MKYLLICVLLAACGTDPETETGAEEKTTAIELEAERGQKGEDGAPGPRGEKGEKGDKGEKGVDGAAGADGQLVTNNMWYDSVAEQYWLYGPYQVFSEEVCTGDWRLPTQAELEMARLRGFYLVVDALAGPQTFWTSERNELDNPIAINKNGLIIAPIVLTQEYGVACIASTAGEE